MFVVYESGKKANREGFSYLKSECWANCSFPTMEQAIDYAKEWLGHFAEAVSYTWDGSAVDYSGYADTIEIRRE